MGEKEPTAKEIDREIKEARKETEKAINETIARLRSELDLKLKLEETPESVTITMTDANGKERAMGFMKMAGMEKLIEARLRFPDENIDVALKKTKKLKKEKNSGG